MTTKYLLPCECGEKLTVDASESGLTKSCTCGAELEVPTLRGLAKLERLAEDTPPRTSAWGNRQRGVVVGLLIAALGFGLALYWALGPQVTPYSFSGIEELPENAPPGQVLEVFHTVEHEGLVAYPPAKVEQYHRERLMDHWRIALACAIGVAGLVVIGASLLLTMHRRPVARPAAPKPQSASK